VSATAQVSAKVRREPGGTRQFFDEWKLVNVPSCPQFFVHSFSKLLTKHSSEPKPLLLQESRILWNSRLSLPVWLVFIVIHFDWPKQMRERELGEFPLAVFLDIHLSHHKRVGDFVLTDCCLQINVL